MGIHCVNSTARPFLPEDLSVTELEAYFTEKVGDHSAYDAFMVRINRRNPPCSPLLLILQLTR